ncbi:MAG: carboxylating nicotinate-nucleotide diphosphorylase [Thermoguttaceae bacterium]|jgi:nicotinate-nucleotide pyrophosphorylase (carboxylating)
MTKDFPQIAWDRQLESDWQDILRLAIREDLGACGDWTSNALVPAETPGRAAVVARRPGVLAGLAAVPTLLEHFDAALRWAADLEDGQPLAGGRRIATLAGPARAVLGVERLLLNLLGHLSGIATLTRQYVETVAGTKARIYDTRKTTPGWRRLEKYAVRCGGGWNHRLGLGDAILIKDNHLAFGAQRGPHAQGYSPAEAVKLARRFLQQHVAAESPGYMIVEIEVDTLEQLDLALTADPDLVLLDNMGPERLRQAVARRDARNPGVELEASGGIDLESIRAIAEAGVERISVGALTHSAVSLDIGLDWLEGEGIRD